MQPRIDVEISSLRIWNMVYSLGREPSDVGSEQVVGGGGVAFYVSVQFFHVPDAISGYSA